MTEFVLDRDYYHKHTEIYNWCSENFGQQWVEGNPNTWSVSITFGAQFYRFEKEEDATLFALKWLK